MHHYASLPANHLFFVLSLGNINEPNCVALLSFFFCKFEEAVKERGVIIQRSMLDFGDGSTGK